MKTDTPKPRHHAINSDAPTDFSKRRSLFTIAGISAGIAGTGLLGADVSKAAGAQIHSMNFSLVKARLISIPGIERETLLFENNSDQAIEITKFVDSELHFDDSVVDCDAACRNRTISLPANKDVMVQFDHTLKTLEATSHTPTADFSLLPEGTRVVSFELDISGNVARVMRAA